LVFERKKFSKRYQDGGKHQNKRQQRKSDDQLYKQNI